MLLGSTQGEGGFGEIERLIEAASDMGERGLAAQKVPSDATSIRNLLRRHRIPPAPRRERVP
jgi:hypothetical protein